MKPWAWHLFWFLCPLFPALCAAFLTPQKTGFDPSGGTRCRRRHNPDDAISSASPPDPLAPLRVSASPSSSSSADQDKRAWKRYDEKKTREMSWLVRATSQLLGNDALEHRRTPPGRLPRESIRHASAVMRAWARRSSPHVVERLILRINEERAAGNAYARATTTHFNSLLEAWCRSDEPGALRRAAEILDEMEESGAEGGGGTAPNVRSYNIMLKALLRSDEEGSLSRAEALLKRAEKRGAVNVRSYNLLLSALSRRGDAEKAEALLRDMQRLRKEREDCSFVSPDINTYNQVISAWSRSRAKGSPQRAQAIFDEVIGASNVTKVMPDTETFNSLMGCWHRSRGPVALQRVEELFDSMDELYDAGNVDAKPDVATINTVLSAYSGSRQSDLLKKARFVYDRSLKKYRVRPNTLTCNLILKALASTRAPSAAKRAMEILDTMEGDVMDGKTDCMPDAFTYTSVIDILSKSNRPNRGRRAEDVLKRMEKLSREGGGQPPNTQVFNALLNCWACSRERGATRRAEATLRQMEACSAAGNVDARPNVRSYNTVLKCLSRDASRGKGRARRALDLLDRMERMRRPGEGDGEGAVVVAPDAYSYTTVIHAFARSSEPEKALRAQEVLLRMVESYTGGNEAARPNVYAFNACLNAAAFTFAPREKIDAFLIAVSTILLLQKFDEPDHTTFGTMLRICSNLMPEKDDRRQSLVRIIFKRCRAEGQVGEMVLEQLGFAAAPDVYEALVGHPVEERVELSDLPSEWRRNVKERRQTVGSKKRRDDTT